VLHVATHARHDQDAVFHVQLKVRCVVRPILFYDVFPILIVILFHFDSRVVWCRTARLTVPGAAAYCTIHTTSASSGRGKVECVVPPNCRFGHAGTAPLTSLLACWRYSSPDRQLGNEFQSNWDTKAEQDGVLQYGKDFLTQFSPVQTESKNGAMITSCICHGCNWAALTTGSDNKTSYQHYADWYYGRTSGAASIHIDTRSPNGGGAITDPHCKPFPAAAAVDRR
jgi:hypothetical protein